MNARTPLPVTTAASSRRASVSQVWPVGFSVQGLGIRVEDSLCPPTLGGVLDGFSNGEGENPQPRNAGAVSHPFACLPPGDFSERRKIGGKLGQAALVAWAPAPSP